MLVHGPGPVMGQPYRLQPFQKDFVNKLYRYDPVTGRRIVRQALLGLGKGNAKTELLAAIALEHLGGSTRPPVPNIPVGAASYQQAGILFDTARTMIVEGPLRPHFECFEAKITVRDKPGVLYRVAAEAGTNDGGRPTLFIADELHEWVDRKQRVHLVIANSLNKQPDPLELNISTAGYDRESLLGVLYDKGLKVRSGEVVDPSFLFEWYEADPNLDPNDPEQLLKGIRQANPGADVFWPTENLVRRFADPAVPEFEFRRYHLNQWTTSDEAWLPAGAWEKCATDKKLVAGARVCLGLDGSFNGDATALVAVSTEDTPHVEVVGCWERPGNASEDWAVDVLAVEQAVREACKKFSVVEIVCDPFRWQRSMQVLERERLPVVTFDQNASRMGPATAEFIEAVAGEHLTHGNDPALNRHVANGQLKASDRGVRLAKDSKKSKRHIDLAVAAVMAHSRARFHLKKRRSAAFIDLDQYM